MRVAAPVDLSPEERARLLRLRGRPGPRALRSEIVLRAADGAPDLEIAHRLGIDRQTVARWRRKFLTARVPGLDPSSAANRAGRIPEERLQAIVRSTVARSGPHGRPWSTRALAREFGVSHMTVRRLWESYGIRPARIEAHPPRPDPVPTRVPWDVIGLYLRPPVAALTVTLHPPVALSRSRPTPDPLPALRSYASESGVTRTAPAFRPLPALARREVAGSDPTARLLGYLAELAARSLGGPPVRVLLTGIPASDVARLDRWRVRHPGIEFDVTGDLDEWKIRANRELFAAARAPAPRRQFRARAELTYSLARSVGAYSNEGRAFEWTAQRQEIVAGEAAYRLRYDLASTGHPSFKTRPAVAKGMGTVRDRGGREAQSVRHVLRQYLRVRPRERVTIDCWTSTLDYANLFVLETLRLGARPLLLYQDEPTYWAATTEVPATSLESIGEHRRAALEQTDVFVSFFGPSDRERFHSLATATLLRLGEYQDALYRAAAKAGARAVQMAIGRVSEASARMYGVDASAWWEELVDATLVPQSVLRRRGRRLAERLERGRELELRHPNGSRLALRLCGRTPHVSDGSVSRTPVRGSWDLVTLPAGVVQVAVDESYAEGSFLSNVECSTGLSNSVGRFVGGRWTFDRGRLRQFSYADGYELFSRSYRRAREGRDRPASVSIGLNEHTVNAPLLEDQSLGTVGLHLGRNDHLGGKTRTPWWAWIFQRGTTVTVDGKPVLRAGRLVP
ncbi:MAG: helix-turn-helix domain-containing protein [Thermoplasmata archaeon]